MAKPIYVGNLVGAAAGDDVDDLLALFGQFGGVCQARVIVNRETGRSRGFGFVEMENDRDAEKAIQGLNGTIHNNQLLDVALVESPTNYGSSGANGRNGVVNASVGKLPPELLDWARRQFTEEEIVAGVQEIRKTGGLELKDFIQEIEDILF